MKGSSNAVRRGRFLIGCIVAGLLLAWIGHKAALGEVLRAMQSIPIWAFAGTLTLIYLSIPFRVLQWRILLGEDPPPSMAAVTRALCVGYLGSAVAPTGGGELLKSYVLSRSSGMSFSRILASVVLVRVQDLPPVIALAVAALYLLPVGASKRDPLTMGTAHGAFLVSIGVLGIVLVGFLVLWTARNRCRMAAQRAIQFLLPGAMHGIAERLGRFNEGLGALDRKHVFWVGQTYAALCWGLFALAPIPLFHALGLDLGQACVNAVAVVGIATLVQLLPITPGGLGTYHLTCVWVLTAMNPAMSPSIILAYAVVSHVLGMVGPALPGLLMLPWVMSNLGRLTTIRAEAMDLTRKGESHDTAERVITTRA